MATTFTDTGDHLWATAGNWSDGVPDSTKDAIIASGTTALDLESTARTCKSLTFAGTTACVVSGAANLTTYGSFTLHANVTWSQSGTLILGRNNGGTITTAGVAMTSPGTLYIGYQGTVTVTLADNFNRTGKSVYMVPPVTLDTGGYQIGCTTFGDGGSGNLTLTLGSSTINCTNVSFAAATLTVTANTATVNVVPTATVTLNTSSTSWGAANFNVGAASKTVNLGAALTHTGAFTHVNGTLDLKGLTLTTGAYASSNTNTRVLQDSTGGANIIVTGVTGTVFDMATTTNLTVSNAPAVQIGTSALTQTGDVTFAGGGKPFGNFTITKHAGNYSCILTGSNTFATFTCATPDATYQYSGVKFTAGTTTTVTSFVATGTASYPIPITSVTGSTHTLSDSAGTNTAQYCTISYSVAQGGASWLTQSCTDGGNNTGWTFGNRRRRLILCGREAA